MMACAATSIMGGKITEPSPSKEKDLLVLRRNCQKVNKPISIIL